MSTMSSEAVELLSTLRARSVRLWADGESLRYEAPTGAITQTVREQIARHKPAVLELLRREVMDQEGSAIIPRAARDGPLPLSHAQQRLWFLDQLAPGNPFYNVGAALPIRWPVNAFVLERSLNEIMRRHEALRTSFLMVKEEPQQVIAPALWIPIRPVDLTHHAPAGRRAEALRLAAAEAATPFDLAKGPLLRATLLKLGTADFHLLLIMHHIVCDGWSMGALAHELAVLYEAFVAGRPSPLPALPIQYADYAVWQRRWLAGPARQKQLEYWRSRLAGLSTLELPTDRIRPALQSYRGSYHPVRIDPRMTGALRELSHREGATLFMTLLAGWKALLARYSCQQDIVVGVPVAGRNRVEVEGLIGFFVNSLVLRTDLGADPPFREIMRRVRESTLEADAHQDLPFEMLVEELLPDRDLSRNPLFQVTFQLFSNPGAGRPDADPSRLALEQVRQTAIFDLMFILTENSDGLVGGIEYSTDLFDAATVQRMALHFHHILEDAIRAPDRRLSELSLASPAEEQVQLGTWCGPSLAPQAGTCLHRLFQAQARRTPDAVAVRAGSETVSFAELDRRTDQLARDLRDRGVGPDELVAIYADRSIEMVVGVLATLKADGAYLPLDPTYPAPRLRFMCEDARPRVLLAHAGFTDVNADGAPKPWADLPIQVLELASGAAQFTGEPPQADQSAATERHLAYVIYTSGSTGQPRGVMIEHGAICNHMRWMHQTFGWTARDRVLHRTPLSFDASVWELFAPLLSGAELVMFRPGRQDAADLVRTIREQSVTVLQLVPSLMQLLLDQHDFARCDSLRLVFCGGETLTGALAERFAKISRAELHNLYGPTEACIDATCHHYQPNTDRGRRTVPIGRPICNMRVAVMDAQRRVVPAGVPGELYLAGAGLARGYRNRPDITAERFIRHSLGDEPDVRLYRTGDLVRSDPEGRLEFLGRTDHQVKIRGYRVELGEIEAALMRVPGVSAAAVTAREDTPGVRRLVAYVVFTNQSASPGTMTPSIAASGAEGQHVDPSALAPASGLTSLRRSLESSLPEYMVPSAFILMDELPLTHNGKIDRAALPAPDRARPDVAGMYVPPATDIQRTLSHIWAEVLGIDQVGIRDNFFELGGDSILSIQVVSRAVAAGLHVTPQQVFQHRTIEQLAAVAGAAARTPAEQGPVTGEAPLTPIQYWFVEQARPEPHHFNQSVLVELGATVNPAALRRCVYHLVNHHDSLRLRLHHSEAGGWKQSFAHALGGSEDDAQHFVEVELPEVPEEQFEDTVRAATAAVQRSLDLSNGPVARFALLRRKSGGVYTRTFLLVVIHHLAVDGVSWRILLDDLTSTHEQALRGVPVSLRAKTTSFKHWSHRLAHYAHSPRLRAEFDYWVCVGRTASEAGFDHALGGVPLDFIDAQEDSNLVGSGRDLVVELDVENTVALLHEVPKAYRTEIGDALLTALCRAWSTWTGNGRLLVDLEGHGREYLFDDADLTRTTGWFTSLFPVLLEAGDAPDPGATLRACKEILRRVPHHGIGYGLLRYMSDDSEAVEALRQLPRAHVCFNYLGQLGELPRAVETSMRSAPSLLDPLSRPPDEMASSSPLARRTHLLEINCFISGSSLRLVWTYAPTFHRPQTIERLSRIYIEELCRIIAHCKACAGAFTPSDFLKARLNQDELDKLLTSIGRGVGD